MTRSISGPLLIVSWLTILTPPVWAGIVDSINASATPASPPGNTVEFANPGNDIGWYYTPSFSYKLDGISTNFGAFGGTLSTPTITVQIQSERPVNGGVLLAEGTFQGNSAIGGIQGASFSPILLTAGTTYFVDLMNINGMGVDLGTWQTVAGHPAPAGGATVNLGADYSDTATSTGFPVATTGGDYGVSTNGVNVAGGEPILFFSGSRLTVSTPEPSSIILAMIAFGGLFALRRRKS